MKLHQSCQGHSCGMIITINKHLCIIHVTVINWNRTMINSFDCMTLTADVYDDTRLRYSQRFANHHGEEEMNIL